MNNPSKIIEQSNKYISIPNVVLNDFNSYNNEVINLKQFKYYTEIILLTNTKDLYNMIDWLYWHLNVVKIEHIIVVDNGAANGLKQICELFDNVDYYYEEIHEQAILLNKYLKISEAEFTTSIDEDEYIYIRDGRNFNDVLKETQLNNPDIYKFSISWVYLFSKNILNTKPVKQSYIDTFNYIYNSNTELKITDDSKLIKTFISNRLNNYYINAKTDDVTTIKQFKDFNIIETNLNSAMCPDMLTTSFCTVHNPLTILNGQILPSYNLSNYKYNYGAYNENDNNQVNIIPGNVWLIHYKYRTLEEWINKIKFSKFPDVINYYYDNVYNTKAYLETYNAYIPHLSEFNEIKNIYINYADEINKLKNEI